MLQRRHVLDQVAAAEQSLVLLRHLDALSGEHLEEFLFTELTGETSATAKAALISLGVREASLKVDISRLARSGHSDEPLTQGRRDLLNVTVLTTKVLA